MVFKSIIKHFYLYKCFQKFWLLLAKFHSVQTIFSRIYEKEFYLIIRSIISVKLCVEITLFHDIYIQFLTFELFICRLHYTKILKNFKKYSQLKL